MVFPWALIVGRMARKFATSSEQLLRVIHYRDGSLIVLLMLTQDELIDNVMMLPFLS